MKQTQCSNVSNFITIIQRNLDKKQCLIMIVQHINWKKYMLDDKLVMLGTLMWRRKYILCINTYKQINKRQLPPHFMI